MNSDVRRSELGLKSNLVNLTPPHHHTTPLRNLYHSLQLHFTRIPSSQYHSPHCSTTLHIYTHPFSFHIHTSQSHHTTPHLIMPLCYVLPPRHTFSLAPPQPQPGCSSHHPHLRHTIPFMHCHTYPCTTLHSVGHILTSSYHTITTSNTTSLPCGGPLLLFYMLVAIRYSYVFYFKII